MRHISNEFTLMYRLLSRIIEKHWRQLFVTLELQSYWTDLWRQSVKTRLRAELSYTSYWVVTSVRKIRSRAELSYTGAAWPGLHEYPLATGSRRKFCYCRLRRGPVQPIKHSLCWRRRFCRQLDQHVRPEFVLHFVSSSALLDPSSFDYHAYGYRLRLFWRSTAPTLHKHPVK